MKTTTDYLTLEDYLTNSNGTDIPFELVDGELVEMPPESRINNKLASFLIDIFATYFPKDTIGNKTAIAVSGKRATARIPDVTVLSEEGDRLLMARRSDTVTYDMPPPVLVVEVVSPGQENRDRDYRHKHTEYAAREIPEYWIVDPELQQVTVCVWNNGRYDDAIYSGGVALTSSVIPNLELTDTQIFERQL
ncbi:MAG: Uma2 family endonuclease [Cyanobacteria bacterium J06639_1]